MARLRKKRNAFTTVRIETLESRTLLHGGGSLSGFVYVDSDGNGTRDENEVGIPGIVVRLTDGEGTERSMLTDDRGFYDFEELEAGEYSVSDRPSSALIDAVATAATDVVLADDEDSEENNFSKQGLRPEFINVLWFFASAPQPQKMLRETLAIVEDAAGNTSIAESIRAGGNEVSDDHQDDPGDANASPETVDDAYTVEENNELKVDVNSGVLANDTDPDGDPLTATLLNQATNGSVTLSSDGSFTYTPNDDFSGDDTFTYSASDGDDAEIASVTITVTPAAPNTFTIDENSPAGTFVGQVEAGNDDSVSFEFDDPNIADTFQLDEQTGELTVADGVDLDFETTSSYTFSVVATNGSSSTVDVIVNLRNVNEAGPIAEDDSYEINEDGNLSVPATTGVLANDTDSDGDDLTATVVSQPSNGIVVLTGNGSFTYEPDDNFAGTDRFTYRVTDGDFSDNGEVTIQVNSINDLPVANADTYAANQGVTLTVTTANGVLANDSDADGETLVAEISGQPANGTVDLSDDGSFVYTPNAEFSGSDSFTYRAIDGIGASSIGTVMINVNPSNRAPVAVNDEFSVGENAVLSVAIRHSILVNDTDPDGDTLTASVVNQTTHGILVVNPDGTFTYTPDVGFSGDDSFTYRANDGEASSNVATVSITVTPTGEGENLFGPVVPGSFEADGLIGIRTDLIPGAPPITAPHVDGDLDYSAYSNPPTYGPHHGFDPEG
ncbi:MAG: tandem-95 repeat protein, partial [Planctomycetales bacterium]|nr:tandem-95 repeat protein [Planctomycetales bacterium]